jgi:hypothetical protein
VGFKGSDSVPEVIEIYVLRQSVSQFAGFDGARSAWHGSEDVGISQFCASEMSLTRILRNHWEIREYFECEKGTLLRCCFMELEAAATQNIEVQEYYAQDTKCRRRITWRMTREEIWPRFRVIFG